MTHDPFVEELRRIANELERQSDRILVVDTGSIRVAVLRFAREIGTAAELVRDAFGPLLEPPPLPDGLLDDDAPGRTGAVAYFPPQRVCTLPPRAPRPPRAPALEPLAVLRRRTCSRAPA